MKNYTTFSFPHYWLPVLANVQAQAPSAFLGGGCLRDSFNDKPVNDIDIFVPSSKEISVRETHPVPGKIIHEPYLTHSTDVMAIRYFEDPTGHLPPVNLIAIRDSQCTPWAQLERFDFGICQVAFDGDQLFMSTGYGRDVKQKTFTLKGGQTDEQREYSLQRWDRLSQKYPDWKLVDLGKTRSSLFAGDILDLDAVCL